MDEECGEVLVTEHCCDDTDGYHEHCQQAQVLEAISQAGHMACVVKRVYQGQADEEDRYCTTGDIGFADTDEAPIAPRARRN